MAVRDGARDGARCAVRGARCAQPHCGAKKFTTFGRWSKVSCPGGRVCCPAHEIAKLRHRKGPQPIRGGWETQLA